MSGSKEWIPGTSLVFIVFCTVYGLARVPTWPIDLELSIVVAVAITSVLLVIGVAQILTVRYLVLPHARANVSASEKTVVLWSYYFAVAPAVYGIIIPVFTSQGLLALPFGAIALVGLALVWSYFRAASP